MISIDPPCLQREVTCSFSAHLYQAQSQALDQKEDHPPRILEPVFMHQHAAQLSSKALFIITVPHPSPALSSWVGAPKSESGLAQMLEDHI